MRDLGTLYKLAEEHQLTVTGQPFGIYHGPINHEDNGPIEICLPVEQSITPEVADVTSREVAGGKAACVTLRGEQCAFPALLAGYDAVQDWIQQNRYEAIEAPREVWYGPPGDTAHWDIIWLFQEPGTAG